MRCAYCALRPCAPRHDPHPDPPPQGGRESTRPNLAPMGRPLGSPCPCGCGRCRGDHEGRPYRGATGARMPTIPTPEELGSLPRLPGARPVGSYDLSPYASGAREIADAGARFGQAIEAACRASTPPVSSLSSGSRVIWSTRLPRYLSRPAAWALAAPRNA